MSENILQGSIHLLDGNISKREGQHDEPYMHTLTTLSNLQLKPCGGNDLNTIVSKQLLSILYDRG